MNVVVNHQIVNKCNQPFYKNYKGTPDLLGIGSQYKSVVCVNRFLRDCAPTSPTWFSQSNITNLNEWINFGKNLVNYYQNNRTKLIPKAK